MPIILALGRQRQDDTYKFKTRLGDIASFGLKESKRALQCYIYLKEALINYLIAGNLKVLS